MELCHCLIPRDATYELIVAFVLGVYTLLIVYGTRLIYEAMISRGIPHNVAIYYNRKIIHMAAGGVVALITPFFFSSPLLPSISAFLLGLFLYYFHWRDRLLYWFQTSENMYEVNFTIAWGVSLLILWILLGDAKLAVIPAVFIAFGDAVTGIVRNYVFARRTKHWIGNIAMALVVIPLGFILGGIIGALAGALASVVERFEYKIIDDNILIALSAMLVLLLGISA